MIYKYTKCESVIAKIMSDLDSGEARNRITDIREWIFEAIEKIGAPMQYLRKESGVDNVPILKIQDNQVPLPDDLVPSCFNDIDGYDKTTKIPAIFVPLELARKKDINGQAIQNKICNLLSGNAIHACILENNEGIYITVLGLPSLIK